MKHTKRRNSQGSTDFIRLSTYIPITGYVFIALLIRMVVLSPLVLLLITPIGWSVKWLAICCPVLMIMLIFPMRFSFARAMMITAQGENFSIWHALNLTKYRIKMQAGLWHALCVVFWGLPFLAVLAGLCYIIVFMDAFAAIRIMTSLGAWAVSTLSAVGNFFIGIFGGTALQWTGGFMEGIYAILGITALALLVFLWGIWRCSLYRYFWAIEITKSKNTHIRMRSLLRSSKWKQFTCGLYNLFLWLPTFIFAFLAVLSIHKEIAQLIATLFETKTLVPIVIPPEVILIGVIGLIFHLFILPIRRSMTAHLVNHIHQNIS